MTPRFRFTLFLLARLILLASPAASQVRVLHREGTLHGFLALRTTEGEVLASGDLVQSGRGNRVTARLTFHFKDGSLYDETSIFTQDRTFRLLSDHLVQKGPSFPHPVDVFTDTTKGQLIVRSTSDGKEQVKTEHITLPPNLSNGIVSMLLKNVRPEDDEIELSMVVATPKPRLIKLAITRHAEDLFAVAGSKRKATHFVVKFEIGGIAGAVAPLIGKQPPDTSVWIADGETPVFIKSEGPLYADGPIWRIELTSPVWPEDIKDKEKHAQ